MGSATAIRIHFNTVERNNLTMKKKVATAAIAAMTMTFLAGCSSRGTYAKYLTLGEYKGLSVTKVKTEVTDDDVEAEIESALDENAEYTDVDRAAKDGDQVNIDFDGSIDGEAWDSDTDYDLVIGSRFVTEKKPKMKSILVTKDVNLRMKARSIGLLCEDYINDKVINVDIFEKSNEVFEGVDPTLIDRIYSSKEGLDISEFDFKDIIHPNECFVLKSDRNSVLARYNPFTHSIIRVMKGKNYGIEPRNAEQSFAFEILNDPNIKLVALTGKAGTGKTLLALAAALGKLTDYKQILLARPVVALSNKDIGFLPGDAQEKVAPYMQPLFDNLNVIKRQFATNSTEVKRIEDMQKSEQLVIEALAFIRGRSLSEMYCIIDEAQNLTPNEIKTIITRAGEGTKMVFTGDIQQIDQPYLDSQSNGLVYMIDRMKDQNIFAHVNLLKGERSELSELASNLL